MTIEVMVAMLGVALSSILATVAVIVSLCIHKRQHQFNQDLEKRQRLFQQRQLLLPLWEYLSNIRELDSAESNAVEIIRSVNVLELVALCVEAEVIDKDVIRRTFSARFIEQYEAIEAWAGDGKRTGRVILRENPATQKLYTDLIQEHRDRDRLSSIGE